MIQYSEIQDKSIALLIWNAEKVKDIHVYRGRIIQKKKTRYFINEARKWQLRLDDDQYCRLKAVTEDVKEVMLGADYGLSMSMSNLPETDPENFFLPTGMKWL